MPQPTDLWIVADTGNFVAYRTRNFLNKTAVYRILLKIRETYPIISSAIDCATESEE